MKDPDQQSFNSFTSEYSDESLEMANHKHQAQNSMSSNLSNGQFFLTSDSDQIQQQQQHASSKPLKSIIKSKKKRGKKATKLSFDDSVSSVSDDVAVEINDSVGSNGGRPLQSILKPTKQLKIADTYEIIPERMRSSIVERKMETTSNSNGKQQPTTTYTERRAIVSQPTVIETRQQFTTTTTKPTVTIVEKPVKQTFTILESKNIINRPSSVRDQKPSATMHREPVLRKQQQSKPTVTIVEPATATGIVPSRSKSANLDNGEAAKREKRRLIERSRTPVPLVKTPVITTSISPTNHTSTTNQTPLARTENSQSANKRSPLNFSSNVKTYEFVSPTTYASPVKHLQQQQQQHHQQHQHQQQQHQHQQHQQHQDQYWYGGYQLMQHNPNITQIHDAPPYTYYEAPTPKQQQQPALVQIKPSTPAMTTTTTTTKTTRSASAKPKQQVVAFVEPVVVKREHTSGYSSVSARPKTPAPKFDATKQQQQQDSSESSSTSKPSHHQMRQQHQQQQHQQQQVIPKQPAFKVSTPAPSTTYYRQLDPNAKVVKASNGSYFQLPAMTIKPIQPPPPMKATNNVILQREMCIRDRHYAYLDKANNISLPNASNYTVNKAVKGSTVIAQNRYAQPSKTRQSNDYAPSLIEITNRQQQANNAYVQALIKSFQQLTRQQNRTATTATTPTTPRRKQPIAYETNNFYAVNHKSSGSSSDEKALISASSPVQNKQVKFEDEVAEKPKTPVSILKKSKKPIVELPTRSISLGRADLDRNASRLPTKTMVELPSMSRVSRLPTKTSIEYSPTLMNPYSNNLVDKSFNRSISIAVPFRSKTPKIESPKPLAVAQSRATPKITELERDFQIVPYSTPTPTPKVVEPPPITPVPPTMRAASRQSTTVHKAQPTMTMTSVASSPRAASKKQPEYQLVQVPAWILKPIYKNGEQREQKINLIFNPSSLIAGSKTSKQPTTTSHNLPTITLKLEPKSKLTAATSGKSPRQSTTSRTKSSGRLLAAKKAITMKPEVCRSRVRPST